MFQHFFADVALYDLPLIAMGIFLAIFATVVIRVCQRSRKPEYERMASLPLDDDSQPE